MPNEKRRVQIRRVKAGANDPIERARQAGIKEGREAAKADYKKAEKAAVARAKADERAVRDDVMARMEKEIEDLQERCRVLERRQSDAGDRKPRRERQEPWSKQHETKEWIAPFNEEENSRPPRQARPVFQGEEPEVEPDHNPRRPRTLVG